MLLANANGFCWCPWLAADQDVVERAGPTRVLLFPVVRASDVHCCPLQTCGIDEAVNRKTISKDHGIEVSEHSYELVAFLGCIHDGCEILQLSGSVVLIVLLVARFEVHTDEGVPLAGGLMSKSDLECWSESIATKSNLGEGVAPFKLVDAGVEEDADLLSVGPLVLPADLPVVAELLPYPSFELGELHDLLERHDVGPRGRDFGEGGVELLLGVATVLDVEGDGVGLYTVLLVAPVSNNVDCQD